jgi:hypothetical protein
MPDVAGFPYTEIEFAKDATLVDPLAPDRALDLIQTRNVTDLLVLSHGWNNDMAEARNVYSGLLAQIAAVAPAVPALRERQIGVVAVLWPSKRFADDDLIPGGAASLAAPDDSLVLVNMLRGLKGTFDAPGADAALAKAQTLVPSLQVDPNARREFADLIRSVLVPAHNDSDLDASRSFFDHDGDELIRALSMTGADDDTAPPPAGVGGAADIGSAQPIADAGGAASLNDLFGGITAGARNLMNYTTYYQMKQRAGLIGETAVNALLRSIRARFPQLKVHLVGHSFGARLVTAAASGPASPDGLVCDTLTLLQGAFSHYALAENYEPGMNGFFRGVVANPTAPVRGPVVITCSKNDRAVGIAYAIASRVANQVASALGDENDKYGGLGRNGAQRTPHTASATLIPVGGTYGGFEGNKLFNLNADGVIMDHNDIRKPEVAYAILSAMAAT